MQSFVIRELRTLRDRFRSASLTDSTGSALVFECMTTGWILVVVAGGSFRARGTKRGERSLGETSNSASVERIALSVSGKMCRMTPNFQMGRRSYFSLCRS